MSKGGTLTFRLVVEGADELKAAFAALPREMKTKVRDASELIAMSEVPRLQAAARASSEQAALVAPSVTAKRGDVPSIMAGGSGKIAGHDASYSDVLFGAEFGGGGKRSTQQFRRHQGTEGYWLFPTLRDDQDEMAAMYEQAITDAQEAAGLGGGV